MMVHLMNSSMMPKEGTYILEKIIPSLFFEYLQAAHNTRKLKSWIGYTQNVQFIKEKTGIQVNINRNITKIAKGDRMLIMKLKYRVGANQKGQQVNVNDFEFYLCHYMP